MDNYQELYYRLFNRITDVIAELKVVQLETEELYSSMPQDAKVKKMSDTVVRHAKETKGCQTPGI